MFKVISKQHKKNQTNFLQLFKEMHMKVLYFIILPSLIFADDKQGYVTPLG